MTRLAAVLLGAVAALAALGAPAPKPRPWVAGWDRPNDRLRECGFERNQKGWCFAFEFSPTLFGYFIARKLALEQLHLGLGVLPRNMVRGSSAPHAKPFLKVWIPADF